jgi:hypothetical protein
MGVLEAFLDQDDIGRASLAAHGAELFADRLEGLFAAPLLIGQGRPCTL